MNRRGFLAGIGAAVAASCLPKVKVERPPAVATIPAMKWSVYIYGHPIVYLPRKTIMLMEI